MKHNKIIGTCHLCEEKSLHVFGAGNQETQQCISCGYVSSANYILGDGEDKSNHKLFNTLTDEMKNWAIQKNNRIWLPTIMTLPVGMLYPSDDDKGVMIWNFSSMVNIPEEEQKDYPIPEQEGKFYTQKYDTDNQLQFEWFAKALKHVNDLISDVAKTTSGNLPNLEF
tara:strand:- start:9487 stop:9990 length:504 start_codon:yes stop_codon:yes gene_type:complete